jgi:hypothetical protein
MLELSARATTHRLWPQPLPDDDDDANALDDDTNNNA